MKNLKEMRNKEIVAVLKSRGVAESEYTDNDGKWVNRKELIALYLAPVREAKASAKEELGRDFERAIMFWKQLKGISSMDVDNYMEAVESWKLLNSLVTVSDDKDKDIEIAVTDSLLATAEKIRDVFCPGADVSGYSNEELSNFIEDCLEQFALSVYTKRLVKESTDIIKMSMSNIEYTADGNAVFDTSKANRFTGEKIEYNERNNVMRIVESSEDGISRMLEEKGISSLTVFMGLQGKNDEEQLLIDKRKGEIFRNGITDVATGKHYMFAFQNPSSCRKANYMFVEAETWEDVKVLWLEITGMKDWEQFLRTFLDKEGKVVMSKLIARISTRGSNSFNLSKVSPEWAEKIAKARIDYTKDIKMEIDRPYRTMTAPGCMELVEGQKRTITPGDGQMIGSFEFHALMAVAMRVISENEYYDFKNLWEAVGKNVANVKPGSRLMKLIKKIPGVFQLRHEGKKGICVRYNLEAVEATKDIDAIVPDSVRKFVAGDWSEFPLEICNYLKRKKEWVALNPQSIAALQYEDPNSLNCIAEYWLDYMQASLNDPAKAQQFHGIIKSTDDESNSTIASNLVAAMRTSSDLINESQICNWRKAQYRKFLKDMQIGRILVPGSYTYMVCDPAFLVAQTYGIELPHLAEGEYYYNGKDDVECGLFRSPLIHPSEAQKVNLKNREEYWYMQDVIVFNAYEGAWDRMGGADFDGDTCAVVPGDTVFGALICKGIKDYGWDVWEPAATAQKVVFDIETTFIDHLVKTAKRDRTGKITNENTYSLDIANHLRGAVYFAKNYYCVDTITFIHPQTFGEGFGRDFQLRIGTDENGNKTMYLRGFVLANIDFEGTITFEQDGIVGTYTLDRVLELADYYENLVSIGRLLQGREIDGAKTGVYAEGKSGQDYVKEVQTSFVPTWMRTRKESLDRPMSAKHILNQYRSMSVLGRLHDFIGDWDDEKKASRAYKINEQLSSGSDKMFLLHSLLTAEEAEVLNRPWLMSDNSYQNLIQIMKGRKTAYNNDVRTLMSQTTGDDQALAMKSRKEREINEIYGMCQNLQVKSEIVAVAAYIATYDKDSKQNDSLTYGWILFDELLSVFSRGNRKFELFRLPSNVEEAFIRNGFLYVNDKRYLPVDAYDCDYVAVQVINGRNYGLIQKRAKQVVEQRKADVVYNSTIYTIGAYGFKYHIAAPAGTEKDAWKKIVADNGFVCDIIMDATNRPVISVNGKSIAALMRTTNFELMGKKIKFVDSHSTKKETAAAITGLNCVIIGEAE